MPDKENIDVHEFSPSHTKNTLRHIVANRLQPLWQILGILWLVATITFGLMQLTNDDVVDRVFTQQQSLSLEAQADKRAELGLTAPVWLQYSRWLGRGLQGDFGQSMVTGEAVSSILWPPYSLCAVPWELRYW